MTISCYLGWFMTNYIFGLTEELLSGGHISFLREHRVYEVAISIYGSVQVAPLTTYPEVSFINVPGVAGFASPP